MTNAKAEFVSAMMRATLDTSDLHVVAERMVAEGWRPPLPDGEPTPVPYAEHERILAEEIERRDEAEEWADKLAAALAPPHVVGGHSLKNHPWRNALEWAKQNRPSSPAGECTNCQHGAAHHENSGCYGVCGNYAPADRADDSETEWGRRWTGTGVVQEFGDRREDAEDACYPNTQLVRREVGPWTEVQP